MFQRPFLILITSLFFIPFLSASADDFVFDDFDDTLYIDIVEQQIGDTFLVNFAIRSWDEVVAFQWTLDYNTNVELIDIVTNNFNESSYKDFGGYTTFSHIYVPNSIELSDGEILFSMKFIANGEASTNLTFSNLPTPIEIYNSNDEEVLLITNSFDANALTLLSAIFYLDENGNCLMDDSEYVIPNFLITIDQGTLSKSNENGRLRRYLQPGNYLFSPGNQQLWDACELSANIVIPEDPNPLTEVEIGFQPRITCSSASISTVTPFLRRCIDNNYYFTYCNEGTTFIEEPEIEIDFPEQFIYKSASLTPDQIQENKLILTGEPLSVGNCKEMLIVFETDCDQTALGETYCIKAQISPSESCIETQDWSGADIEVSGECVDEQVVFNIKNVGTGDMTQPRSFIVIEDDVMTPFPGDDDEYDIGSQDSIFITLPANGRTYRIVAEEEITHPLPSMPTIAVEGCGEGENGEVSLGFVNQFPESDNAAAADVFCTEIIGAFDPNDKQGFPRGYGQDHLINNRTDMEYLIRFQNTGNDTAFNVFIEDSIRGEFDLRSIEVGPASHPFTWEFKNDRTVVFRFDNILLPDSTTNEPASNGFIKYKIKQEANNVDGTILENVAGIFFDFNEPIITNTTQHIIGSNFLLSDIKSSNPNNPGRYLIYPNPTHEGLWIENLAERESSVFSLYSQSGQLLFTRNMNDQLNFIDKKSLSVGLHFYTITTSEGKSYSGKITVLR